MRSAERILADMGHTDDKGMSLVHLKERYTKAAMLKFCLDREVVPYLVRELCGEAKRYAADEGWHSTALRHAECLALLACRELERPMQVKAKIEYMKTSEATWHRRFSKPYEALYGDLVGWAFVGRRHAFRQWNAEELAEMD